MNGDGNSVGLFDNWWAGHGVGVDLDAGRPPAVHPASAVEVPEPFPQKPVAGRRDVSECLVVKDRTDLASAIARIKDRRNGSCGRRS